MTTMTSGEHTKHLPYEIRHDKSKSSSYKFTFDNFTQGLWAAPAVCGGKAAAQAVLPAPARAGGHWAAQPGADLGQSGRGGDLQPQEEGG